MKFLSLLYRKNRSISTRPLLGPYSAPIRPLLDTYLVPTRPLLGTYSAPTRHLLDPYSAPTQPTIFLKELICVHLPNLSDKFNTLLLMTDKLLNYATNRHQGDNLDSLANQEVLLTGHLYQMIIRERISELLQNLRYRIIKDCKNAQSASKVLNQNYVRQLIEK